MAKSLERSSQPGTRMASPATVIGKAVATAATARRPRTRYRVGFGARPRVFLSRLLPDRTFDALVKHSSGVPA
ncbi:hypothetical protein [Streptomyces sp. GbtcB6]|uniref:hypothetical protein n=1 Tax=Streptomyces sp. GbtcB6 TaxID=2824751 RepID=UPI0020C5EE51|nr:hypothetical protein [Streptomyces sp. GbtcB6]